MSLVVLDTETGGLEPHHPTIQIGAIAVDEAWNPIECFEVKLKFDVSKCTDEALASNHYDAERWQREAVMPLEALLLFKDFMRRHADLTKISKAGRPYKVTRTCGHNSATFDMPRLMAMHKELDVFFLADFGSHVDTKQLWTWVRHACRPKYDECSGRLTDLTAMLGGEVSGAHDAVVDCGMTAFVAPRLLSLIGGR